MMQSQAFSLYHSELKQQMLLFCLGQLAERKRQRAQALDYYTECLESGTIYIPRVREDCVARIHQITRE